MELERGEYVTQPGLYKVYHLQMLNHQKVAFISHRASLIQKEKYIFYSSIKHIILFSSFFISIYKRHRSNISMDVFECEQGARVGKYEQNQGLSVPVPSKRGEIITRIETSIYMHICAKKPLC